MIALVVVHSYTQYTLNTKVTFFFLKLLTKTLLKLPLNIFKHCSIPKSKALPHFIHSSLGSLHVLHMFGVISPLLSQCAHNYRHLHTSAHKQRAFFFVGELHPVFATKQNLRSPDSKFSVVTLKYACVCAHKHKRVSTTPRFTPNKNNTVTSSVCNLFLACCLHLAEYGCGILRRTLQEFQRH